MSDNMSHAFAVLLRHLSADIITAYKSFNTVTEVEDEEGK